MEKFKYLEEAIRYALDYHYEESFEFEVDGKLYYTDCVSRSWAALLMPELYYELYDEIYEG